MKLVVQRFEVIKTIGEGYYGKIKLAKDLENNNHLVAIKILNLPSQHEEEEDENSLVAKELSEEEIKSMDAIKNIRKEMEALQKCHNHENVIDLYDVVENEEENQILLVMEYCDHGDLFEYIDKFGKIKEECAQKWFSEIVQAVHYIHSNGVVHRDLKPENILLTSNSKNQVEKEDRQVLYCRIVDFGLCGLVKKKNKQQLFHSYVGTENYCCPELLQGKSYNGFKADAWSLGCILYTMLVGIYPFDADTTYELIQHIVQGKYEIPSFVSPAARDLIQKILIVDPDKRYSVEQILSHSWVTSYS